MALTNVTHLCRKSRFAIPGNDCLIVCFQHTCQGKGSSRSFRIDRRLYSGTIVFRHSNSSIVRKTTVWFVSTERVSLVMKYILKKKKDFLTISVQSINYLQSTAMSIYTFFTPTLPCLIRLLEPLDGTETRLEPFERPRRCQNGVISVQSWPRKIKKVGRNCRKTAVTLPYCYSAENSLTRRTPWFGRIVVMWQPGSGDVRWHADDPSP